MLTIQTPAKINLTLEVLSKRPDGYHEIRSVIQAISLHDTLHFESNRENIIKSDDASWIAEQSLVSKAVALFRQATGSSEGVEITVERRIPLGAGLGGDSSDAAAVLRGLNRLWQLSLPFEKLLEMARQLGSDVSFFLYGGTALLEGRGEIVTPLPNPPPAWLVLGLPPTPPTLFALGVPPIPPMQNKTKLLYEVLRKNHYTDGSITRKFIEEIKSGGSISNSMIFNTFENVAFSVFPGLNASREHFIKLGTPSVHLAGSGPALFSLMPDNADSESLYIQLNKQRMSPVTAQTIPDLDVT